MDFPVQMEGDTLCKRVSKLLLIMKLSLIIILFAVLQVSANGYAQQVTLKQTGITLKSLFKQVKKQTGYDVIYVDKVLNDKKTINASFNATPLRAVLEDALAGLPVDFVIDENTIVLSRKAPITFDNKEPVVVDIPIQGKVTDDKNQPLPGVTVKAATTASESARASSAALLFNAVTVTKNDGSFSLEVGKSTEYIVFSYVGYETKVVKFTGQQVFTVNMVPSKNPLDEIQVIAYGSTTRRSSTGSVSSVKAEQIAKQPISNPLQALEGRVPGVMITEGSGVAGGNVTLQIRGMNTISAGSTPLYIIDGVPFNAGPTEKSAGAYSTTPVVGQFFSPFDNIPTSDIESIEILKDADATAIYGSRAANGVVVITTRKGKSGIMKFNANVYSGASEITHKVDMLHTDQYFAMRQKAFANDNLTPTDAKAPDLLTFGKGNTDFVNYIMGNTSHFTDATLGVSGGSRFTQYMITGNYRHQSAVFPENYSDNRATVRFNLQSQSENNKFSINLSGAYTKNDNNLPAASVASVYTLPPNLPLTNPDGSFYWNNNYTNPAASLLGPASFATENILANSTLKYNILPGLSFKTDLGFNKIELTSVKANTRASRNPNTTTVGYVTLQQSYNQVYTVEPQLNYVKDLGPGKLEALVGATYQDTKYVEPYFIYGSFTNDLLYNDIASVSQILYGSGFSENKYASLFGRLTYNISSKYILNFTGRRDGSSRFGPGKRFGNFGSVGAAWVFTEENFMKNKLPWLSFGKLRGSYGTIGNDQIADYGYMSIYSSNILNPSYNGVNTLSPAVLANKDYSWEVTKKLEIAADLNFIKDRISFTTAWYRNRSNSLLLAVPVASQTGFRYYTANLGAIVQNTGWEFAVETKNIVKGNFKWSTSFNLTLPKNKLVSFPGLSSSIYASSYIVGQPLSVVQNYHFTGFNDGIAQFEDVDKSGSISAGAYTTTGQGDYRIAGNTDPKFYGGISNSLSYKGFQLDFLFQFVKKDGYNIYNNSPIPGNASNVIADVLNKPFVYTTLTASPAATAFNLYKNSDAVFGDASFIRLKNVSLGYNLNSALVHRMGLQNVNVYMRGQNLLTFTKYLGMDPETMGTAIPPMKLLSFGLQLTF